MTAIRSHSLSVGIVGLPNSGKSTLFNSLTKCGVPAENFPFCTIDKNIGVVRIPDKRLDMLTTFFKSEKVVPSAITFVDIAGLVKGASKGEGLGNQFLSHIREVNAIMYVLRAFSSDSVVHVYNRVNPLEDLKIVESELILKDIETVEKRLNDIKRVAKAGLNEKEKKGLDFLEKLKEKLGEGICAIDVEGDDEEKESIYDLWLLTNKPRIFVLNIKEGVSESDLIKWETDLKNYIKSNDRDFIIRADVKLIGELSDMDEGSRKEFVEMLDTKPLQIDDIITLAVNRLNLLTFYTGCEKEVNAWCINKGATIQEAAGVIHTDLAEKFITADSVKVEDLISSGGWHQAKESGKVRNHGKEYLIEDGEYVIVYNSK